MCVRPPYNIPVMKLLRYAISLSIAGVLALALSIVSTAQRRGGGPPPEGLSFRFLGPVGGNSVASIAGIPGAPFIY